MSAESDVLSEFRWCNRILILGAPDPEDARVRDQLDAIALDPGGMRERDLVIVCAFERGQSSRDGDPMPQTTARALREQFGIEPETFTVLLVGKDGAEKLRREAVAPLSDLFEVIDAMPMRQREIREQRRNP